jgi:hypothetical protein
MSLAPTGESKRAVGGARRDRRAPRQTSGEPFRSLHRPRIYPEYGRSSSNLPRPSIQLIDNLGEFVRQLTGQKPLKGARKFAVIPDGILFRLAEPVPNSPWPKNEWHYQVRELYGSGDLLAIIPSGLWLQTARSKSHGLCRRSAGIPSPRKQWEFSALPGLFGGAWGTGLSGLGTMTGSLSN